MPVRARSIVVLLLLTASSGTAAEALPEYRKDLLPAARLALQGFMVRAVNPVPEHPELRRALFICMCLPHVRLDHAQWDWGDCTGRAVLCWQYLREMTGDTATGRDVERGQLDAMESILAPDTGMPCVPERSRPAEGLYHYQMWDQGRTLRALVALWQAAATAEEKAAARQRIDRMIASLRALAVRGQDSRYGTFAVYPFDHATGKERGDDIWVPRAGQLIEPLAVYWDAAEQPEVGQFLDELVAGVLSGREGHRPEEPDSGHFVFGPDGSFRGHFHAHVSTALGVARYGQALVRRGQRERGLSLLRWSRKVYDWTLAPENVNAGSSWGWFPENTGHDGQSVREMSELCCVADMVEFAACLAGCARLDAELASWDALWDHVERYTFNSILPTQFRPDEDYRRALRQAQRLKRIVRNGYTSLETDAAGCFNHETVGRQTLTGDGPGGVSQYLYGIEYNGRRAWFGYQSLQPVRPHGLTVQEPPVGDRGGVRGVVATTDGDVAIEHRTACGDGPWVVRTFTVTNRGRNDLSGVRLFFSANLETETPLTERGELDPRTCAVMAVGSTCRVGLRGEPQADFCSTGDAVELLGDACFDWHAPQAAFEGNAGGVIGWHLGRIRPGESATVQATLARGADEAELTRALQHGEFPERPLPAGEEADWAAARRLEGAWVGMFTPNELCGLDDDGLPVTYNGCCCNYSGPRALHACWEAAVDDTDGELRVRLPVDRLCAAAEQAVVETAEVVRQRISLKAARRLAVRIPDWADLAAVNVVDESDRPVPCRTAGRWLDLGSLPAGARLTVTYPMVERKTTERVGGSGETMGYSPVEKKRTFTATWRGNRVICLEPAGHWWPVFPPCR